MSIVQRTVNHESKHRDFNSLAVGWSLWLCGEIKFNRRWLSINMLGRNPMGHLMVFRNVTIIQSHTCFTLKLFSSWSQTHPFHKLIGKKRICCTNYGAQSLHKRQSNKQTFASCSNSTLRTYGAALVIPKCGLFNPGSCSFSTFPFFVYLIVCGYKEPI